ncbi:phosphoenolpyruvate synthase [Arachidicoccus terrestris]|uniref:phosphoenolpyruvate synthase n=1 Tax=Arachidicoccus terrestris TaxID=2875539 RepID=UPI001CC733C6|nr:phosphoenolpyruvate synthase [Arachidicoccus terrestris]UAY55669.1 phosphoenolpyruvate synthase [Arachidicoccus terrestris]
MNSPIVLPLNGLGIKDIALVGGKCASLGEMITNLSGMGILVPSGFAITTEAYYRFIRESGLEEFIKKEIGKIDFNDIESLRRSGLNIRQAISNTKFPYTLSEKIIDAYKTLSKSYDQDYTDVAVRSSATAEDLPDASFAGQQETYLNIRGNASLIDAVRNCFASLFTDRAISYRQGLGYDHCAVGLSVCVQKMVRSDLGASGVAFSIDTESGFKHSVLINGAFGLGELVVQGAISPDEFNVYKPLLKRGFPAIIEKKLGYKDKQMVYGNTSDERVKVIQTDKTQQWRFCLEDDQILQLSDWVCKIEEYYTGLKGHWCPVDVEWATDGLSGQLYIVQARPETIHSRKNPSMITEYAMQEDQDKKELLRGIAVGDKIATGKVNILYSLDKRIGDGTVFQKGDVLVTDMTDPDWEPIMKIASAIITNKGGRTCHAAIVAREMGVPAIVGCGNATDLLVAGQEITASCAQGAEGIIYEGILKFSTTEIDLTNLPKTRTAIKLNVASPSMAFKFAAYPNKGVGLAREEFIINNYIKIHPLALLKHKSLNDPELSKSISEMIRGFKDEEDYFLQKLAFGIAKIAAAFYPSEVLVRFSDFKSNEYYNLLGGKYFEPEEENPMIGWRGASRYYSEKYQAAFGLECRAIKMVREQMGLRNVAVMIPFCRTPKELEKVLGVMNTYGLERNKERLRVYLMAEIPSNIILAEQFAKMIDGFSIGSNDLTQLTLGLDRDSGLVADLYDERNDAVKIMIDNLLTAARYEGIRVGICGQGPSDHPDFAKFLVERGIDSISVTPDAVTKTIYAVKAVEDKLGL